ncbi:MAG: biotin/lipoyl-binding protein, partial [Terriglobia bacterium]
MRRGWWPGVVIALVVLGAGLFVAESGVGSGDGNTPATSPVPVTIAVATVQDVPAIKQALGTVTPVETVAVQARVSGQVMQVYFKQGQEVAAGAPLFLIDPRPYQAALDQAQGQLARDQAALQEAKVDLARYQGLARQNSIAKQQAQDQAFVV